MGWDSAGGAGAGFRYAFRGAFGVKCYFLGIVRLGRGKRAFPANIGGPRQRMHGDESRCLPECRTVSHRSR